MEHDILKYYLLGSLLWRHVEIELERYSFYYYKAEKISHTGEIILYLKGRNNKIESYIKPDDFPFSFTLIPTSEDGCDYIMTIVNDRSCILTLSTTDPYRQSDEWSDNIPRVKFLEKQKADYALSSAAITNALFMKISCELQKGLIELRKRITDYVKDYHGFEELNGRFGYERDLQFDFSISLKNYEFLNRNIIKFDILKLLFKAVGVTTTITSTSKCVSFKFVIDFDYASLTKVIKLGSHQETFELALESLDRTLKTYLNNENLNLLLEDEHERD